ncbi:hypothetical protein Esti_000643 [Eimeria stiedai]
MNGAAMSSRRGLGQLLPSPWRSRCCLSSSSSSSSSSSCGRGSADGLMQCLQSVWGTTSIAARETALVHFAAAEAYRMQQTVRAAEEASGCYCRPGVSLSLRTSMRVSFEASPAAVAAASSLRAAAAAACWLVARFLCPCSSCVHCCESVVRYLSLVAAGAAASRETQLLLQQQKESAAAERARVFLFAAAAAAPKVSFLQLQQHQQESPFCSSSRSKSLFSAAAAAAADIVWHCVARPQRGFYYRFHKPIGKGRFSRYQEFYQKPRSLESTQRLLFNYEAPFAAAKASGLRALRLRKKLAASTNPQQLLHVLEAYRHMRPWTCFMLLLALDRLVALGGCDPTDFRFRTLCRNILKAAKRFQNLPRVCWLLSQLRATGAVDALSRHLKPQVPLLYPQQLAVAAAAFGAVRLQHKCLLESIAAAATPYLSEMQAGDLLKLLQGFAGAQLHHYGLVSAISSEVQRRVHAAAAAAAAAPGEGGGQWGANEDEWLDDASWRGTAAREQQQQRQQLGTVPSLEQLVGFLEAFAALKYRDWSFLLLLSRQVQHGLQQSPPERPFAWVSPLLVGRTVEALRRVKANDPQLLLKALETLHAHVHDCCPSRRAAVSLALVGRCTAEQLPPDVRLVRERHSTFLQVLRDMSPVLSLEEVVCTAAFADASSVSRELKASLFAGLTKRLAELQVSPRALCDVPLLAEILLKRRHLDASVYDVLARLLHRQLETLEPHDLARLSRFLSKAKAASLESESLLNATSRHVLRQSPFFAAPDLKETIGWLMQAGPPHRRYTLLLQRAAAAAAAAPASSAAEKDARRQAATTADTAAAAVDACTVGPEDLENSLQRIKNRPGPLLLGRAAVRARAKAQAEAAAAATAATAAAAAAAAVPRESAARRRHRHRQRILEEEGWDLLHRRVGAVGELKRWL